jgi:hypothetical protein
MDGKRGLYSVQFERVVRSVALRVKHTNADCNEFDLGTSPSERRAEIHDRLSVDARHLHI